MGCYSEIAIESIIGLLIAVVAMFIIMFIVIVMRYKKCPADKIMVIYGNVGMNKDGSMRSSRCIHGGAVFVWPFMQAYQFLDLTPISIPVELHGGLTVEETYVDISAGITVGISTEAGVMQNAAERLLGLNQSDIAQLASDIFIGQLRLCVTEYTYKKIRSNSDEFLSRVCCYTEEQYRKIGLRLINININKVTEQI